MRHYFSGRRINFPGWGINFTWRDINFMRWGINFPGRGINYTWWGINFPGWGIHFTWWGINFPGWGINFPGWGTHFTWRDINFPGWGFHFPAWGVNYTWVDIRTDTRCHGPAIRPDIKSDMPILISSARDLITRSTSHLISHATDAIPGMRLGPTGNGTVLISNWDQAWYLVSRAWYLPWFPPSEGWYQTRYQVWYQVPRIWFQVWHQIWYRASQIWCQIRYQVWYHVTSVVIGLISDLEAGLTTYVTNFTSAITHCHTNKLPHEYCIHAVAAPERK